MVKENIEKFDIAENDFKDLMCFYYGILWNNKHGNHLAKRNSFKFIKSLKDHHNDYNNIDLDDLFNFIDNEVDYEY